MKLVWALIGTAACGLVLLYAVTFWAMDKTRDRIECYRAVIAHNDRLAARGVPTAQWKTKFDCSQPGAVELFVRDVL